MDKLKLEFNRYIEYDESIMPVSQLQDLTDEDGYAMFVVDGKTVSNIDIYLSTDRVEYYIEGSELPRFMCIQEFADKYGMQTVLFEPWS